MEIRSIPHIKEIGIGISFFLILCVITGLPITNAYEFFGVTVSLVICAALLAALLVYLMIYSPKSYGRFASLSFFALNPIICFFLVDGLRGVNIFDYDPWTAGLNLVAYAVLELILYAFIGRLRPTIISTVCVSFTFGLVNHFVEEFRGSPFLPWDIFSVRTALSVADNYDITINFALIFTCVLFVLTIILATRVHYTDARFNHSPVNIIMGRLAVLAVVFSFSFVMLGTQIPANVGIEEFPWNQSSAYKFNGTLTSFLLNIKYLMVEKPAKYSPEVAQSIAENAAENSSISQEDGESPNIIVIMNESLSDLQSVWEFDTNVDPLPFIHSLKNDENAQVGNVYVSVHGGTTCNSEFEFLTGNTMGFFPTGTVPFQQYIKEDAVSLPNILSPSPLNYYVEAMHPYYSNGWNRANAYPLLGFDRFLTIDDWFHPTLVRKYVSDDSNYSKVISEFQTKPKGEPAFFFNITMQNHSGYTFEDYTSDVRLEGLEGDYPDVEQYLSLVKTSDTAFSELISYFETVEENTIILMFGDHQPGISKDFYEELYGKSLDELSLEELQKRFITPFIFWSNYGAEFPDVDTTSLNYLSTMLMKSAGIKLPAYNAFLDTLRKDVPVTNANGYMDNNKKWYKWGAQSPYLSELNDYQILQYNAAIDKDGRVDDLFK